MSNNKLNPGELNGSQVQGKQSPDVEEPKKVRDLSDFGCWDNYAIIFFNGSSYCVGQSDAGSRYEALSDLIGLLEYNKLSVSKILHYIKDSDFKFMYLDENSWGLLYQEHFQEWDEISFLNIEVSEDDHCKLLVSTQNIFDDDVSFEVEKLP